MKKRSFWINLGVSVVLFLVTIIFLIFAGQLAVIPNDYFVIGGIGVLIVDLVVSCFLMKRMKKKFLLFFKWVVFLVAIILILFYFYGSYCIYKTIYLLDQNTVVKKEINEYYVIVKKESVYEEINDLYGKSLAYFSGLDEKVLDKIQLDMKYQKEMDMTILKDKLYQGEVEAILISDILKNQYDEDKEFVNQTRVLHIISITNQVEDITKKVSIKNTAFNIYISGIDSYGDISKTSRNDVNIIVTVNPNTNKILLTSIPRDYYVTLHGTTGYRDKLTHASYYGMNMAIQTVEDILDIEINYYVKVNFTTVVDLVDQLGEIEVYADQELSRGKCNFKVGYNMVDGECALAFARERYAYFDGDRHRGRNQQEIIKAIFSKVVQNGPSVIYQYTNLIETLDGKFVTNLGRNELMSYIKFELNDFSQYTIETVQLDGSGDRQETYSYPNQKLWVMEPDVGTIDRAKERIIQVMNG